MKPKLVAILVVGVLILSTAITAAAAVDQALSGDISGSGGAPLSQTAAGADQEPADSGLVHNLKLICPFH